MCNHDSGSAPRRSLVTTFPQQTKKIIQRPPHLKAITLVAPTTPSSAMFIDSNHWSQHISCLSPNLSPTNKEDNLVTISLEGNHSSNIYNFDFGHVHQLKAPTTLLLNIDESIQTIACNFDKTLHLSKIIYTDYATKVIEQSSTQAAPTHYRLMLASTLTCLLHWISIYKQRDLIMNIPDNSQSPQCTILHQLLQPQNS